MSDSQDTIRFGNYLAIVHGFYIFDPQFEPSLAGSQLYMTASLTGFPSYIL